MYLKKLRELVSELYELKDKMGKSLDVLEKHIAGLRKEEEEEEITPQEEHDIGQYLRDDGR